MMSLSMSLSPSLSLSQELRHTLGMRLSLVQKLAHRIHGDEGDYRPKGTCPACERRLTPAEIIRGFNRNPTDLSTKCPRCKLRFAPKLVNGGVASSLDVPFYCSIQTLGMLEADMLSTPVEEFKKTRPAIYRSAMYHFGSLTAAFKKANLRYSLEPKVGKWEKKVLSFLGKLPDVVIARTVRASVGKVRKLREERGIEAYSRAG